MNPSGSDITFAGSIPQLYDDHFVPLLFEPYAEDMARRVARLQPSRVLEIAAGTGVLTRRLAQALPPTTSIVASDLHQPMLDHAASVGTVRPVEWRQADAMQLPFPDEDFDVVVCQFGVMFFPDKAKAFAEAKRVLRPGGVFLFSVWDGLDQNEFPEIVNRALETMFPAEPSQFMARVPHGYHDPAVITRDLELGGFDRAMEVTTLTETSRAPSPRIAAVAFCLGTPMRNEIEKRDPSRLGEAVDLATAALASRFGTGAMEGRIQAHIIMVER
jgi:SAM-dependent methyltransferase